MSLSKKQLVLIIGVPLVGLLCIGGLAGYIVLNPQSAADFTDNVIRPIIGDKAVIRLEKLFYNTTDIADRFIKRKSIAPTFEDLSSAKTAAASTTNLNITPLVVLPSLQPMDQEGVWHEFPLPQFPNQDVMATTFIRPDQERPYAVVTLAQLDMNNLRLGTVAGLKEPGTSLGHPGTGRVPDTIKHNDQLIAAFDGGFLYNDGQYGMVVGSTTYAPLKQNIATLIGYEDGTYKIVNYTGQDLGQHILFIRQNCPILIAHGELSVLTPQNKLLWGRTLTAETYTWRSGIGITKEGNLLYAAGNNLTPTTLAYALKSAGAVDAMQLDINPAWMSFNLFTPSAPGQYDSSPLTKDFRNRGKQFLHGYNKDFFYLYKK